MKYTLVLLVLLVILHLNLQAQTIIRGRVLNEEGQPLPGAHITLSYFTDNFILAFAFSKQNGSYSITVDSFKDSLEISVSHLGYKTKNRTIVNSNQEIDFLLEEQPYQIVGVVVKAPIIEKVGDTIMYSIPAFIREHDRVIGDVLNRLPGIEVMADGRILYEGKPIQKFYIEGLDLLGGRYNLATNNLPAEAVSQVQIIENHQPIKILDDVVFSDRASLNIKLKRDIAWTGTAQLGSGFEPTLWNASATPMLFSRRQQMILTYQTNNVGDNLARELNTLTIEDLFDKLHSRPEKSDWVRIQTLPRPDLTEKTWLNNTSHMGSANYLLKLNRDFQLRVNAHYLHHIQRQSGNSFFKLFTPLDTISFFQNINNEQINHSLGSTLTLTRNIPQNYLVNELEFNTHWDRSTGFVKDNGSDIRQNLKAPLKTINNRLINMVRLGRQIATVRSYITYTNTNQTLLVSPGPFANVINHNNFIDALKQEVNLTSFFTNNFLSFTRNIKGISITPKVGFWVHNRQLDSFLWQIADGNSVAAGPEYVNQLLLFNRAAYARLMGQYRYKSWRIEASGRITYNYFGVEDHGNGMNSPGSRVGFEPSLSVHKDLNSNWKISSEISKQVAYGSIEHIYQGFILLNSRLLQRNSPSFLERSIQNFRIYGSYKNIYHARFFNWAYSFLKTNSNLIFSHTLDAAGFTQIQAFERPNIQNTHIASIRLSQYIRPLRTNISFSPIYTFINQELFLNNELTKVNTHFFHLSTRFEKELFNWFDAVYSPTIRIGINEVDIAQSQKFSNWLHILELNFYPARSHNFNLEAEYYQSFYNDSKSSSFLMNFSYNLKLPRRKLELYLAWNNIFNNRNFQMVNSSQFGIASMSYVLRPSELHFGIRYSF